MEALVLRRAERTGGTMVELVVFVEATQLDGTSDVQIPSAVRLRMLFVVISLSSVRVGRMWSCPSATKEFSSSFVVYSNWPFLSVPHNQSLRILPQNPADL